MASDLQQLGESLKSLPPSFWKHLRNDEKPLLHEIEILSKTSNLKVSTDGTHHQYMVRMLDIEEPITLRIYGPLIYGLRTNWTDHALDFYILVKAHVTRLTSLIQRCSGDPALVYRTRTLIQRLEKEVQKPKEAEASAVGRGTRKSTRAKRGAAAKRGVRSRSATPARKSSRYSRSMRKRAKPLTKEIKVTRRRIRR